MEITVLFEKVYLYLHFKTVNMKNTKQVKSQSPKFWKELNDVCEAIADVLMGSFYGR